MEIVAVAKVEMGRVLAGVDVDLEEGYIGKFGTGYLEYLGAVRGKRAADGWTGNDAAHLDDFDATQGVLRAVCGYLGPEMALFEFRLRGGVWWSVWSLGHLDGLYGEGRQRRNGLSVRGLEKVSPLQGFHAGLSMLVVHLFQFCDCELLYGRFDCVDTLLVVDQLRVKRRKADHAELSSGVE